MKKIHFIYCEGGGDESGSERCCSDPICGRSGEDCSSDEKIEITCKSCLRKLEKIKRQEVFYQDSDIDIEF